MESFRADAAEINRLSDALDLSRFSFAQTERLIVEFIARHVLRGDQVGRLPADVLPDARAFAAIGQGFLDGSIDKATLDRARIEAWTLHDRFAPDSPQRHLLRVVVSALFDSEAAEFETYGAEPMFEAFYGVLFDLDPALCGEFTQFALSQHQTAN